MLRRRSWAVLLAAALVTACGSSGPASTTPAAPTPAPPIRAIVVLGDSLAVSPSLEQSFPARLDARIAQSHLRWTMRNAGVSGDTTADGIRRFAALLTADVGVLVVELGANDGLRGLDLAAMEQNLTTIVATATQRNVRVLLCGMETPPGHGLDYSVAFHFAFPRVAQQQGVPLVPFLLSGVALDPELTGSDGVHPNAAGAQRIADTVWPYLEPMLQQ
jgi:acyl-CoA thioesterase I